MIELAIPGAEILEAGDLCRALELVKQADVILCDGHFPKGNIVTSFEVQQNPWLSVWAYKRDDARFALLSGDEKAFARGGNLGLRVFMKPCHFASIIEFVRGQLSAYPLATPDSRSSPGENLVVIEQDVRNESTDDAEDAEANGGHLSNLRNLRKVS